MLAHSWGDNVWRTFMRWVTVDDPGWVERHLAAYVNIAGTVLGVSKSTTSLLSGDDCAPIRAELVANAKVIKEALSWKDIVSGCAQASWLETLTWTWTTPTCVYI